MRIGKFSISFKILPKSPVVVFDQSGSEVLEQCVLKGIPHFVLCSRQELFYLNPSVLLFFLKNILRYFRQPFTLGTIFRLYLMSCIEILAPKIILTFVDNSYEFQWIARHYRHGKCYAVQNGMRLSYNLTKWLPPPPHPASRIYLPNFLCFGDFERELYTHYGHQVDHFHPVGSLRGGYYYSALRKQEIQNKYDLCIISEWDVNLQQLVDFVEMANGVDSVERYLAAYIKQRDLRICIATRIGDDQERDHFRELFGENVDIIKNDREAMSTYHAINESNVSVAAFSTVGVEAFGWGKKVFLCNLTGNMNYSLPLPDICHLDEPNFDLFCMKIDSLLAMEESKFRELTSKDAQYLMNYNFNSPAHEYLQCIIKNETHVRA